MPVDEATLDQPLPELQEQALQWLVDLHDGKPDAGRWDRYLAWSEQSPAHRHAALDAESLWENLGARSRRPRRRTLPLLVLGMAAMLGVGSLHQAQEQGWLADQHTGPGERRELHLADGSTLMLAPNTRVDIRLDGERRRVRLYSGELYVEVAADPAHPFDVESAGVRMRALGTAFDARNDGGRVRLVVTEHRVGMSVGDQTLRVDQGQALDYANGRMGTPRVVDVEAVTAWRRDRLVFDGEPLGEVLDTLGRYHRGLIWVSDPRLRALPVTGSLPTQDADAQLRWLEQVLPVRIQQWPWLTRIEPLGQGGR